jgi:S-methylmethionine-dependent homocysteine/selenocysteine methylase
MADLRSRLGKETLILDGALGTELEKRGVDTSRTGWTSRANIEHPELVIEIHREYVAAGAQIITANSFRTNPIAHRKSGFDAKELTFRAVQLAKQAIGHRNDAYVAGSLAPALDSLPPQSVHVDDRQLLEQHSQMAQWLEQAGVDLILIETMNTAREAYLALTAAKRACTLPIAVSLVPANSKLLISGASLDETIDLLAKSGADALLLNCQSLSILSTMLGSFASHVSAYELPWGVYPNASEYVNAVWQLVAHEDHEFAAFARQALDHGASIIGGCCGTTPHTIESIVTAIRDSHPQKKRRHVGAFKGR